MANFRVEYANGKLVRIPVTGSPVLETGSFPSTSASPAKFEAPGPAPLAGAQSRAYKQTGFEVPAEASAPAESILEDGVATAASLLDEDEELEKGLIPSLADDIEPDEDTDETAVLLNDTIQAIARALGIETSVSTFRELALSLVADGHSKDALVAFLDAPRPAPDRSTVPIDSFADVATNDRAGWQSHCRLLDEYWNDYVSDILDKSDGQIDMQQLSKPSGPLKTNLVTLWNYPTMTTSNGVEFSHTMDPGNPSLRLQMVPVTSPLKLTFADS